MAPEAVQSDSAPKPVGPYSQAVRAGCLVFVSGQIPLDPATGRVVEGGFRERARRALQNVMAILEAAGLGPEDVVKVTVYLTDISRFQEFNEVYKEFFRGPVYPARAVVQVAALPLGVDVEVEAVAYACRGGGEG